MSAVDWSEWSPFLHGRCTPEETASGTSLSRSLGGPQSRAWCCGEVNILLPLPVIEPRFLCRQPVAHRYTDWAIPALRNAITLWNCKAISFLAVSPSVVLIVPYIEHIYLEMT
jgi:hypothetical protein